MRAAFDTNVLINYLLSPARAMSATHHLFQAAVDGRFTLLLMDAVVAEFSRKLRVNARLGARISQQDIIELLTDLRGVAEPVPYLPEPYPTIGRDRDDDFLIAHCVFAHADYLLTWDKDMLDLDEVDGIRMVRPPTFLQILRDAGVL